MTDIVDASVRSRMMSQIRSRDTKPELILRKALHGHGFRYRLHYAKLPGKPDLVLARYRAAIYVHGCFWHRHTGCRYAYTPTTRVDFWTSKFRQNVERDHRNIQLLENAGWNVKVVWECELRKDLRLDTIDRVIEWLKNVRTS